MIGVFSTFAFLWSLGSYFALVACVHERVKPWVVLVLLLVSTLSAAFGLVLGMCGIVIDDNKVAAFAGCFLNLLGVAFWATLFTMGAIIIGRLASSPMFA